MTSFSSDQSASRSIVVITDGEDHEGNAIDIAASAAKEGVQINIIGIGSPGGAPIPSLEPGTKFMTDNEGNVVVSRLNEQMGMEIAQSGHGMYVRADNSNSAIQALVSQLDELETTTTSSLSYSEYDENLLFLHGFCLRLFL